MEDAVTTWIRRLKEGDSRSEQEIWNAYCERLVTLARKRLRGERRRDFDEEDVAISAFNSFFRAVKEQRLPKLDDRTDLWKILVVITARKVSGQRKRIKAEKRGGGRVRGESIFALNDDDQIGIEQALGAEPTPEVAAEVAETCQHMMEQLSDATLQRIAQLKLEGYSNREISEQLGCVERTVERKLERIRADWANHSDVE